MMDLRKPVIEASLIGCGNDDLGIIELIDNNDFVELRTQRSGSCSYYFVPFLMLLLFSMHDFVSYGTEAAVERITNSVSLVFLVFASFAMFVSIKLIRWQENRLLPLLQFDKHGEITFVRGKKVLYAKPNSFRLCLIHALNFAGQREVVELQLHVAEPVKTRLLIVSLGPGDALSRLEPLTSRIAIMLDMEAYLVTTVSPKNSRLQIVENTLKLG